MSCILIAGGPRQGKSKLAKSIIMQADTIKKPCYVYDPQNEYGNTYKTKINNAVVEVPGVGLIANRPEYKRSRYTPANDNRDFNVDYFTFIAEQKKGSIIMYDESTGIFKGMLPKNINRLLTGRFPSGNSFVFIFHSLVTIPPDFIRNSSCNTLILFKTMDNPKQINSKFENAFINEGFRRQDNKPNFAPPTIIQPMDGIIDGHFFERQKNNTLF
jgi:hypothetical protein